LHDSQNATFFTTLHNIDAETLASRKKKRYNHRKETTSNREETNITKRLHRFTQTVYQYIYSNNTDNKS